MEDLEQRNQKMWKDSKRNELSLRVNAEVGKVAKLAKLTNVCLQILHAKWEPCRRDIPPVITLDAGDDPADFDPLLTLIFASHPRQLCLSK